MILTNTHKKPSCSAHCSGGIEGCRQRKLAHIMDMLNPYIVLLLVIEYLDLFTSN